MPARTFFGVVRVAFVATALYESEFTIGDEHVARRTLRQETTIWARLTAESERAALAAFEHRWRMASKPRHVRRGLGTPVGGQRPFDMVLWQTMSEDGSGMIKDDAVGLAISRTQTASDHLAI